MNKKLKILAGIMLAIPLTVSVTALAWGPTDRQTYTMAEPADHATFNSITDSSSIGDERDFVRIVEKNANGTYSSKINIEPNKEYDVYIYYHNNASATYNDKGHGYAGVATDVKLTSSFPLELKVDEEGAVSGVISWTTFSDRDTVQQVWDEAWVTATEDLTLQYVTGTAKIYNGGVVNGNELSTDLFSEQGTYLGYNDLNGILPGCDEYAGHVNFTIRTQSTDKSVKPFVSVPGIFSAVVLILIIVAGIVLRKKHKKA